ncbi:hypothetical protein vseg_011584 [Gypsophila vaccaria]
MEFLASQVKINMEVKTDMEHMNRTLQQISSHQKHMDTQISKLPQTINNFVKTHNAIPGIPEVNPKGQLNAVTLRSGKVPKEMIPVPKSRTVVIEEEETVNPIA